MQSSQSGKFPFGQETKSYHYGEIVTPYQKPQKQFDSPIGEYIQRAKAWRVGFVAAAGFSIFLLFILIMIMNSSPFHIYAVSITNKGYAKAAGQLKNEYTIPDFAYKQFLMQSINFALNDDSAKAKTWLKTFFSDSARYNLKRFLKMNYNQQHKFRLIDFKRQNKHTVLFSIEMYDSTGMTRTFILKSLITTQTPQKVSLIKMNPFGFHMDSLVFRVTLSNGLFNNLGKDDDKKQGRIPSK